jgi:hypothetical protein
MSEPRYGTRDYRLMMLKRRMDEMLHGHGDEPTAYDVLSLLRDVVEELPDGRHAPTPEGK